MTVTEFCTTYKLSPAVMEKFHQHAFENASHFCFITIPNLTEMGFLFGEIAALRDAAEKWSAAL